MGLFVLIALATCCRLRADERPHPVHNPASPLMLDLPETGTDPTKIDFNSLPKLAGERALVSNGDDEWKFRLHSYLEHFDGKYWCIWSHGPVIEDKARQHVRYSTSTDGIHWNEASVLVGPPKEGYGYIARGLWLRNGELLALASLYEAPSFHDGDLELVAFRWDRATNIWRAAGRVWNDTLNNFAPDKLPTGAWMMIRRDAKRGVSIMIGGVQAIDRWTILPFSTYTLADGSRPEEPACWLLPDKSLVGVFRDNSKSRRLLRAFSTDNGRTWSTPVRANFPDATSKFFTLRLSTGEYAMISNPNPKARRPLCLSLSKDGLVFTRMATLPIPAEQGESLQYPHAIERDGHLLIAYSRNKTAIETVRIQLGEAERLK